jgi:hypothetical protein
MTPGNASRPTMLRRTGLMNLQSGLLHSRQHGEMPRIAVFNFENQAGIVGLPSKPVVDSRFWIFPSDNEAQVTQITQINHSLGSKCV